MAGHATMILTAVPPNIRHALTRWMIEPRLECSSAACQRESVKSSGR